MEIREIPWKSLGGIYEQEEVDVVMAMMGAQVERSAGFFRLPEEPDFERAFAEHEGCKYAAAVNSCGTGLDLAMRILDIGPGDQVITTPVTFVATAHCIAGTGAEVVLADIDPHSYNLDPDQVKARITPKTKAVLPVHMNGMPADIDAFADIADRTGIKVVYDAAHAVGIRHKGRPVGPAGDMSVYSFQTNKNMSTLGEGGMVTTNNKEYHARLQRIKSFGFEYGPVDDVLEWGSNYRMTKIQSAVGHVQLKTIGKTNSIRHQYAHRLSAQLSDLKGIITPFDDGTHTSSYHLYMLRFDDEAVGGSREEFIQLLKGKYRIGATIHYPPLWQWSYFKDMGLAPDDTPVGAKVLRQLFNVPVFPRMSEEDVDYVAWAIRQCVAELA